MSVGTGFIGVQVALLFADDDQQLLEEADGAAFEIEDFAHAEAAAFEASREVLEGQLDRLTRKIESLKAEPIRGLLGWLMHRRRTHRIDRLQATRYRVSEVLRQLSAQHSTATAAEEVAQQSGLYDPRFAHKVLRGQAKAGLSGMYVAPPGFGRLVKLPMYAVDSSTNPRNALSVPGVGGMTTEGLDVSTEDLPYALVKLVGFVSSVFRHDDNNAFGLVENLRIRGGTNLFLHEGSANAEDYNTSDEQLRGLRSYPNIRSPNNATVTLKVSGDPDDVVILTASCVVDCLEDDTYGAGFAGPYAG